MKITRKHFLHLFDEGDDEPSWEIVHPESCPEIREETPDGWGFTYRDCGYELEVSNCGNDSMDPWPTEPGCYPLKFWHTVYHHWELGEEHDAGIEVGEKLATVE